MINLGEEAGNSSRGSRSVVKGGYVVNNAKTSGWGSEKWGKS